MKQVGQVVRFEGDIEDELRRIGMFRVGDGHRSNYSTLAAEGQVGGSGFARMDIITIVKLCNFRSRENVRPTKIIFFFGIGGGGTRSLPPITAPALLSLLLPRGLIRN